MAIKISAMSAKGSATGTEIIPVSDSGSPFSITGANLKAYIIDAIEALAAHAEVASAGDSVFVMKSGVMGPSNINYIAEYVWDVMWAKAAETSPDDTDILLLKDGSTEKTVTLALIAAYVLAAIEADILNFARTGVPVATTLVDADIMLATQSAVGKRTTALLVANYVLAKLSDYMNDLPAVSTPAGADIFYCRQGSDERKVTLAQITATAGNVSGPGSTTEDKVPQWDSTTKLLKDGLGVVTTIDVTGFATDLDIPTEDAVRNLADAIVNSETAIAVALEDADEILVHDTTEAVQNKATLTQLWTWALANIVAQTDASTWGVFLDEDNMASDSATKVASQQSIKAYVDAQVGSSAYKNIWIPASEMTVATTAPAAAAIVEHPTQDYDMQVLDFAGSVADEFAAFTLVMPPEWNRGTIKFKYHWFQLVDASAADYVKMWISAISISDGTTFLAAPGTEIGVEDQLQSLTQMQISAASDALTASLSPDVGDVIQFKIRREYDYAGSGSAMTEDLRLIGIEIQYLADQVVAAW